MDLYIHVEDEENANKQIEILATELYRFVKTLVFNSFDNENKCMSYVSFPGRLQITLWLSEV